MPPELTIHVRNKAPMKVGLRNCQFNAARHVMLTKVSRKLLRIRHQNSGPAEVVGALLRAAFGNNVTTNGNTANRASCIVLLLLWHSMIQGDIQCNGYGF